MITVGAKNRLKTQNDNSGSQKSLETTIFIGKKQLGPDNNTYLAQIITPKMAKLGWDNNFTAYIYIRTHACACCLGASVSKVLLCVELLWWPRKNGSRVHGQK